MQNTTQAWVDNQSLPLVSESFVEIEYKVTDPGVQEDASAADNGAAAIADTAQITTQGEKNEPAYALLEQNSWILNGGRRLVPAGPPYGDTGFLSAVLCGDDCRFDPVPVVTLSFTEVHQPLIPGVTITWSRAYGEYARSFEVTAYQGESVVAQKRIDDNSELTSLVSVDIQGYDRMEIAIYEWSRPLCRAKLSEVMIGFQKIYTKDQLMGYEYVGSADPLCAKLPENTAVFKISNVNGEFNPDDPQGFSRFLMERQEIRVRYGYKLGDGVEWIRAGTFFISEWNTPQNGITATFTAKGLTEFMSEIYTGGYSGTLYEIAQRALEQAQLPQMEDGSCRYAIDDSLREIAVDLAEDPNKSIAEVVQLCANAACCVMRQDRDGILRIEPLANGIRDYLINQDNSYKRSEYQLSKELKAVSVNSGLAVVQNSPSGEIQTIDNPLIQDAATANRVAQWVKNCLKGRKTMSGQFRADPRLDELDTVTVENSFSNSAVIITEIQYTYNGAFRGKYEGRVTTDAAADTPQQEEEQ
ncbi:hypothetical protein [Feifania hominis]|uniref:Uncharacterized protein n=1 Tax=Feifania hominis TaxID=2763660 RepID=A0A926DGJ3_9FIRM|nr:hypothetical protein [Feifania hominis]MBC8536894.1 hypothetical protein [Feifania hominis]